MARSKLKPFEAFTDNISDAETLLSYAVALKNQRPRRMRRELRECIRTTLKIPKKKMERFDYLVSNDLLLVFIPGGTLSRNSFDDLRPLLRQSLVAACAALETYIADKAMDFVGQALYTDETPPRMREIQLTVGRWAEIESRYKRRQWGIRSVVEDHIRENSSTAPNKIAQVLSTVGVQNWLKRVDVARNVSKGKTIQELEAITKRRNRIAHTADRQGRGRASIASEEVRGHIETIKSVVVATEAMLSDHSL
ncbi:MAG: HEPN domain-containing protein [Dehalococcoidia bacterium]|nr:HEPN domain-containing protein [Dehalococcoidia bacterium]